MTVGELKRQLNAAELNDEDAIVVTRGNAFPSYKITHIEDSTSIGVWEIRIDDFSTNDYWEE